MAEGSGQPPPASIAGIGLAAGAYVIWGLTPIYWKALVEIPAAEVLIPRIVWTAGLLLGATPLLGAWRENWSIDRRGLGLTFASALLLAGNWGGFIYAVQSDQVIATSLGYYINPLVSILLGLLVLGERLNPTQAAAVAIAAIGVATMTVQAGELPWISLGLAGSFALYGLIHKVSPQPAFAGLLREMLVLTPPALLALVWLARGSDSALVEAPPRMQALLMLSSLVTAAPLLLFHAATRRLPLIAVGMFQYIAPTITLFLAIGVYGEVFTAAHATGFGCVWLGLVVFTFDSVRRSRRIRIEAT